MDKDQVNKFFRENSKGKIVFRKLDNTIRTMICAVKPDKNEFKEPDNQTNHIDCFTVWDLDDKKFKTFYPSNVISLDSVN